MDVLARRHLRHAVGELLAAAFLLSGAARAQEETEDELEFSYVPGAANGPDRWGEIIVNSVIDMLYLRDSTCHALMIKPAWANCSRGRMQSPIDLSKRRPERSLGFLNYAYHPAQATIVNRGHDIQHSVLPPQVKFSGDAGRLVINGTVYHLRQLHWHTPSEHTVGGRRYDMELHLVHESAANKAAVIAVLYKFGDPDPFLKMLEPAIKSIKDTRDKEEPVGVVDPSGARAPGSVYYRYTGSLTPPPCSEGVVWTVFPKPRHVARYQVELLRDAVDDVRADLVSLVVPSSNFHTHLLVPCDDARVRISQGFVNFFIFRFKTI
ncbi:alpha carbonic anhydrase 7-like [Panicum virgatum]|uniref:alpha carbonic anhydrase 7-like n=1 Tax=Panicum virgatum TaxID=38727 RepID=UPI0019D64B99|nr:alpha carbonic anhydrase 7-like [Panicum virgatum]